jgi:hypothetical protein
MLSHSSQSFTAYFLLLLWTSSSSLCHGQLHIFLKVSRNSKTFRSEQWVVVDFIKSMGGVENVAQW